MLFSVQSRGTERIGKAFGSVVLVWFSFLAVVGLATQSVLERVRGAQPRVRCQIPVQQP